VCILSVNIVYTYLWCFDDGDIKVFKGNFKSFFRRDFIFFVALGVIQSRGSGILKDEKVSGHGVHTYIHEVRKNLEFSTRVGAIAYRKIALKQVGVVHSIS